MDGTPYPPPHKPIEFRGSSLKDLRDFPKDVRADCGYQIYKLQMGEQPRFEEAVYVLHAFQKKTEQTSTKDVELATKRFKQLVNERAAAAKPQKGKP